MAGPQGDHGSNSKAFEIPEKCTAGLSARRRYLVGVSGGCDSVVLLHWLALGKGFRNLVVCHLNHGLRGRESGGDAAFVRRMSVSMGLPFESEKADVRQLALDQFDKNLEAAGRAARLAFFGRVARKHRCRRVLLAHHADDQVETFFMRLFRGAGTEGLAGMRRETEIQLEGTGGKLTIHRPLLSLPRQHLEDYAESHRLRYRTDSSNTDEGFLRNRLRSSLIPELEDAFGREVKPLLLRTLENLQDERELLEMVTGQALDACLATRPREGGSLSVRQLHLLESRLRRRVIWQWLRDHQIRNLSRRKVEEVMNMIHPQATVAKCNLPGNRYARRRAGRLFVE